jgi:hypothetical protein
VAEAVSGTLPVWAEALAAPAEMQKESRSTEESNQNQSVEDRSSTNGVWTVLIPDDLNAFTSATHESISNFASVEVWLSSAINDYQIILNLFSH